MSNEGAENKELTDVLREHLKIECENALVQLASEIDERVRVGLLPVFSGTQDVNKLNKLKAAVVTIRQILGENDEQALTPAAREKLFAVTRTISSQELLPSGDVADRDFSAHNIFDTALYSEHIIEAIEAVKTQIKASPNRVRSSKRLQNVTAIKLVEVAREIWHRERNKVAPKNLNPASQFGRFLADLMDALLIDASPRSAVKAWRDELITEVHDQNE